MAETTEMTETAQQHPDRQRLEQFGQGALSLPESRRVVRHLLTGCPQCRQVTERFLPSPAAFALARGGGQVPNSSAALHAYAAHPAYDYRPAFAAVRRELTRREIAFAIEQEAATALHRELAGHTFEDQWQRVTQDARFHTWSFCDLLLEKSGEWGFQDPSRAKDLAELGAAVAACLSTEVYGETRIRDLSSRAWATLGNVERIRGDFRAAESAFLQAEQLLKAGTGDPLEKARFLLFKASLRANQGKHREALALLARVVHIARRNGDHHMAGKALISQGFVVGNAGENAAAIRLLSQGLAEITGESGVELRLLVTARHNLVHYLSESGRHGEALDLLASTRALYAKLSDRISEIRLRWVEARIYLGLGDLGRAEELLREVGRDFAAHELGYDAALAFLDLARVYLRQGRGAEMRHLAEEVLPIFRATLVERDILAALIVFQAAVEMERVTLDLLQEFSVYFQQCRTAAPSRGVDSL